MKDWLKYIGVMVAFFSVAISIYSFGTKKYAFNENKQTEINNNYENVSQPVEIVADVENPQYKTLYFQGSDYNQGAFVHEGRIYVDADVVKSAYGMNIAYNQDSDKVVLSKPTEKSNEYIRYNIKDNEYYFYSADIDFADFQQEIVSIADLEQKGIVVSVNRRNTRSDNWEPSYVTDFVFACEDLSYSLKGMPYVNLTVAEDYTVTRQETDVSNLTWRVVENGNVVLERNAIGELSYNYFGNQPGCHYEISLLGYFNGYEVISNVIEYDFEP